MLSTVVALLQTYNLDRFVPDSASAGTALFSGVKAKAETLGLSTKEDGSTEELSSIIEWAQQQDMYTGKKNMEVLCVGETTTSQSFSL